MGNTTNPNTEIDQQLVQWARENLKNVPEGENYEKMISGVPYNTRDLSLAARGFVVQKLVRDYCSIFLDDPSDQKALVEACYRKIGILKEIFGKTGKMLWLAPPFTVDYGFNVSVGENFYANFNACFLDTAPIIIGDDVSVGPNTTFVTASHPIEPEGRAQNLTFAFPIRIGNRVWIGANVTILPGVTVGDGSTIAAGSVVRSDVPSRTVVGGIPARVLKEIPLPTQ